MSGKKASSKDAPGEEHEGYKVVMPPDKFIPVSVSDIVDGVRGGVKHEERGTFTDICQLVEGCATTQFASLRRRVKKNYRFFSAAAMQRDVPTRKGRGGALRSRSITVTYKLTVLLHSLLTGWVPPVGLF